MAVGGGAFGFTASASASYSDDKSSSSSSNSSEDTQVMTITYNFPRVVIEFDHHSLDLSDECKEDIMAVNSVAGIQSFKTKYGRFFATRIELGGSLHASEQSTAKSDAEKAEQARTQKAAAALSFSSPYVQASAKMSHGEASSSNSDKSTKESSKSMCWEAKGGDTLQCNNPPAWAYTVGSFYNWRAVKQSNVLAIEDVISTLPGFQDIKANLESIAPQGYLTVGQSTTEKVSKTDAPIINLDTSFEMESFESGIYHDSQGGLDVMTLKRASHLRDYVAFTTDATALSVGQGTSASESIRTFYVMAKSNQGQEAAESKAKVKYNTPYGIYNKNGNEKKYLLSTPVLGGFQSGSQIMAGRVDYATCFMFLASSFGESDKYVKDGDMVMIVMLDKWGDVIDKVDCFPASDGRIAVGAIPRFGVNTHRLFKMAFK